MAFFRVNPTSTTGVEIAATSAGNKARFLAFGFGNAGASTRVLRVYDGTAAAGTMRIELPISAGGFAYIKADRAGDSIFPKSWFTAGSAIECSLDAAGDVKIFGEYVREV